jgi:hypothetical protein
MCKIAKELKKDFNIGHCTLQPEFNMDDDKSIVGGGGSCGC